jgi:serine/threonine protein kinase
MQSTCPSSETLHAYSLGKLPAELAAELERHLDQCELCVNWLLERSSSDDALMDAVHCSGDSMPYVEEAGCRQGLARVIDFGALLAAREETSGPAATAKPDATSAIRLRDYQLGEILGQGGMGTVYRARHDKLDRIVAVKLLNARVEPGSDRLARFEQEMRAAGQLDHPNIVRATDAGEVDGVPYLAMEFVDGMDLAQWVERFGSLRHEDACEIIVQAARGLQHAYQHGFVHRDIKPANLMLTVDGRVKLLDLGIALLRRDGQWGTPDDAALDRRTLVGTVSYMAPEQFDECARIDIRTDIYSLGGTLFYLLVGQAPWKVEHGQLNTVRLPWQESITNRLQAVGRDIPAELIRVILRMLSPDPADRYNRPGEVIDALAAFAIGSNLAALMQNNTSGDRAVIDAQDKPPIHPHQRLSEAPNQRRWMRYLVTTFGVLGLGLILIGQLVRSHSPNTTAVDATGTNGRLTPNSAEQAALELQTPTHHTRWQSVGNRPLLSLAVSPVGDLVATADESGTIQLWDARSGTPGKTLLGHFGPVWGLAITADGQRLVSAGDDHTVRIWNAATASVDRQLTGHTDPVLAVAWSPDGTRVASAGRDARIFVWNAEDGSRHQLSGYSDADHVPTPRKLEDLQRLRGHITWIRTLAFSPRGDRLTSGGNEALIATWDLSTGEIVQRYIGHTAPVAMVKYTSDGERLVSAGYDDRLRVWDAHDGRQIATLEGHSGPVHHFDISTDDQLLASASADTTVRLWSLTDGRELCCFRGHSQPAMAVCFTADGNALLSASGDATVRTWPVDRSQFR